MYCLLSVSESGPKCRKVAQSKVLITVSLCVCRIRELQSPFPAEHPFYSHTARFSLFPSTQSTQGVADSSQANRPS